jgi:uncharacterized protein (TIGR03086 family)
MDLLELHGRALGLMGDAVAQVRPEQLWWPTPCADWTLYGLLRHQVSENGGFAQAAREGSAPLSVWQGGDLEPDAVAAFAASARLVSAAFAEPGFGEREVTVREFGTFPARTATGMHLVDVLAHGWDVAATIGVPYAPDAELAATARRIAEGIPDAPDARRPGASFAPVLDAADTEAAGAGADFDAFLRALGRSPSWVSPLRT